MTMLAEAKAEGRAEAFAEAAERVAIALEEDHHANGLMCRVCTAMSNPGKRPEHAPDCIVSRLRAKEKP